MLLFFEDIVFSGCLFSPIPLSGDDDFLIYTIIVLSIVFESVGRLPVTQVYQMRPREVATQAVAPVGLSLPQSSSSDLDLPIAHRKGKHSCRHPISSFVSYNHLSSSSCTFISQLDSVTIPKFLSHALSHDGWRHVMEEEMASLKDNQTRDLVVHPTNKVVICCKWVYVVKVNPDSLVARLKAHLVAKGYAQMYGIDYTETFSLVAKLTSVRIFISLVATNHWPLY